MSKQGTVFLLLGFTITILSFSCRTKPTETAPLETKISGRVLDKDANSLISNAQITTSPTTSSVSSDASGVFVINDVQPGQYLVTASKSGYKSNSINVTVVEGKTASADIQLETLKPELSLSVSTIDFGTSQTTATFIVSNATTTGSINFTITKNADWLTATPTSGTITTGTTTITLTANRTGLSIGNYSATITISSNAGDKNLPVTMTIPNPNAPQLTVSPLLLDFGSSLSELTFTINNSGTGKIDWNASTAQSWITITPLSDSTRTETDNVKVSVNRSGLSPANYTGEVSVNSNAGLQTVNVKMSVQSVPVLGVSTTTLDFDSTKTQLSFTINNTGTGTLNWTITDNQTWLTVQPASGTNSSTVNVTISRVGLSSSNYSGQITISSNGGNANISVNMKVPSQSANAPVANFVADKTSGTIPLNVQFTDQSVGSISTWAWDFGDGETSNEQNPIHTYKTSGTFSVKLTVSGQGGSNSRTRTNYITASEILFYEPFNDLVNWQNSGNPGWIIIDSTSSDRKPLLGKCIKSEVGGYGYGDVIKKEITLAKDGVLKVWVNKFNYESVTIYCYVDSVLQWQWGGGLTWGEWTEKSLNIPKGIHEIKITSDFAGYAYIDELIIISQ